MGHLCQNQFIFNVWNYQVLYICKILIQHTCTCVCHYQYCGPRMHFDEQLCSCQSTRIDHLSSIINQASIIINVKCTEVINSFILSPFIILGMHFLPLLLCIQMAFSSLQVIAKSDLSTTITTPGYSTSLAGFHNSYQKHLLGDATFWIWNNEGSLAPIGRTITFETLFYVNCNGPVVLNITADQSFTAYFDGQIVVQGNNYVRVYSVPLNAKCGSHNLTVTATKGSSAFGPGVIFAVFQDQSGCFNCNLNGEWNDQTCSCECTTVCGCDETKVWVAYPTCACICAETIPNLGIYLQSIDNQTKAVEGIKLPASVQLKPLSCPMGQKYSQGVCDCICQERYCPDKFKWVSNATVCACIRMAI